MLRFGSYGVFVVTQVRAHPRALAQLGHQGAVWSFASAPRLPRRRGCQGTSSFQRLACAPLLLFDLQSAIPPQIPRPQLLQRKPAEALPSEGSNPGTVSGGLMDARRWTSGKKSADTRALAAKAAARVGRGQQQGHPCPSQQGKQL